MNKPKHTPGPWYSDQRELDFVRDADGELVAVALHKRVHKPERSVEECAANTCLITAAPEMLEALKQAHSMIQDHDFGGAIITIEDAIAKAEGREP
jgi:hypothetical protein